MVVTSNSIIPVQVRGSIDTVLDSDTNWKYWYPWLKNLRGTNTFVHLSAGWRSKSWPPDPDPGYDHYVISGDSGMWGWDQHVAELYHRPVFLISLPEIYQPASHELVTHIANTFYHRQVAKLDRLSQGLPKKDIRYKVSALTARVTQSKMIVFAAIKRWLAAQDAVVTLGSQLDESNVHHWHPTNDAVLDDLTNFFRDKFLGCDIKIEDNCGDSLSYQNAAYCDSAINFTQESFHYSLMYDEHKDQTAVLPGPFLTEKTFKCLLSQTAFIPVGQFRSYRWLESMGMRFDYGLDLSFDDDPGNITRLHEIVKLVQTMSDYTAQELYDMTLDSTQHNYTVVQSGEFWDACQTHNQAGITVLYEKVLG